MCKGAGDASDPDNGKSHLERHFRIRHAETSWDRQELTYITLTDRNSMSGPCLAHFPARPIVRSGLTFLYAGITIKTQKDTDAELSRKRTVRENEASCLLLVRYTKSGRNRPVKEAELFTVKEHGITSDQIDPDAVKVTNRLKRAGYKAYIVGGAVRDLLLKKKPKDFDIATDAKPKDIKRLFRNSRIIGRRFRLVHIFFPGNKILEVSTFRSNAPGAENNEFGGIEEDVLRRDFTINALYYCPGEEVILDYVGGVRDIASKKVRPIIPLKTSFAEDPVRMLRAVKYSATTGFRLPFLLRFKIKRSSAILKDCSASRLTEELAKILRSGYSSSILKSAFELGLLQGILPTMHVFLLKDNGAYRESTFERLKMLDSFIAEKGEIKIGKGLVYLLWDYLFAMNDKQDFKSMNFKDIMRGAKLFLAPTMPPNVEIEYAVHYLLRKMGIHHHRRRMSG